MRPLAACLLLPVVLTAAPRPARTPRLILREAQVTSGAGREPLPGHAMPDAVLHVQLTCAHLPAEATFKAWKVPAKALPRLTRGVPAAQLGAVAIPLEETAQSGDTRTLKGTWPGEVGPEDRVVVEAWKDARRLAWAQGPVMELHRPQTRPSKPEGD